MTIPDIFMLLVGVAMPLILSMLVPQNYRFSGGLLFIAIALTFVVQLPGAFSPFNMGLAIGLTLSALRIIANVRFL